MISTRLPVRLRLLFVLAACAFLVTSCGDPYRAPEQYSTDRVEWDGVAARISYPSAWGKPQVDHFAEGPLLSWSGPQEPDYDTSVLMLVTLGRPDTGAPASCTAFLDRKFHEANDKTVAVPVVTTEVAGAMAETVHFGYTVTFAGESGRVPRPDSRYIACIPAPEAGVALTVEVQGAGGQQAVAAAVYRRVLGSVSFQTLGPASAR